MIDQTVINRLAKRIKDIPPFPEAPKDGKTYLRKNGAWEEVKQDGWIPALETWTRTGDYKIEINGDVTDKYDAGYKFKCIQNGVTKYGYFLKLEYSAGKTTITVSQNVALTAHSITDAYISNAAKPHSFPYGNIIVGDLANAPRLYVSGRNQQLKGVVFQTDGLTRWDIYSSTTNESGSNAGSNFTIRRWNDDGTSNGNAMLISRNTGLVRIYNDLQIDGSVTGNLIIRTGLITLSSTFQSFTFSQPFPTGKVPKINITPSTTSSSIASGAIAPKVRSKTISGFEAAIGGSGFSNIPCDYIAIYALD